MANLSFEASGLFIRDRRSQRLATDDIGSRPAARPLQDLKRPWFILQILGGQNEMADVNAAHRGDERRFGKCARDIDQHRLGGIRCLLQEAIRFAQPALLEKTVCSLSLPTCVILIIHCGVRGIALRAVDPG